MPAVILGIIMLGIFGALSFIETEQTARQLRATRGKRNNNPGNVRTVPGGWRGQTGIDSAGFAIFGSIVDGVRAMTIDLAGDIVKDGNDTLRGLIAEYAPGSDGNDEAGYTNFLANLLGITVDQKIQRDQIIPLIFGIARFEGQPLYENWADAKVDLGIKDGFSHLGLT